MKRNLSRQDYDFGAVEGAASSLSTKCCRLLCGRHAPCVHEAKESDVVIVNLVVRDRTCFLHYKRRMTLAFSRARVNFIVVGSQPLPEGSRYIHRKDPAGLNVDNPKPLILYYLIRLSQYIWSTTDNGLYLARLLLMRLSYGVQFNNARKFCSFVSRRVYKEPTASLRVIRRISW